MTTFSYEEADALQCGSIVILSGNIDSTTAKISVSKAMRVILPLLLLALPSIAAVPLEDLSLTELEQRLESIDGELEQLASASFQSGVGPIGFRSNTHKTSREDEWVRVDLAQEEKIDEIVLVPSIWRDTKSGFRADAFPTEFRILVGTDSDSDGQVIASFTSEDRLFPRTAPVVVPCPGTSASWVKIEATQLSARAWDGLFILQLSEIFVFSGEENVALRQSVSASSPDSKFGLSRKKEYLVDGFVPYLLDAAQGEQSLAFVSEIKSAVQPTLTIDLGAPLPINRIHLHTTELSDTVPQTETVDFGIPRHLVVEGGMEPDFSDAVVLTEYRMNSIFDIGPIIVRRFPETICRFVRMVALEPHRSDARGVEGAQLGLAEFEIFSNSRNVALGIVPSCNLEVVSPERSLSALTDGRNLYGQIIPTRRWMNELARRHNLEVERPRIVSALNTKHERQTTLINRLAWLVALLTIGIILIILVDRMFRMRHVTRVRERLAADLHDELGANLHTIGLLSDLAAESGESPDQLATLHRRIRSETERSGRAVRHCTDMLEAVGVSNDFEEDMRRASRRIMSRLENEITIEGLGFIDALNRRTRYDLFLFYKECLVNISRHAEATKFSTHLKADRKLIELVISDNGHGISGSGENRVPSSLKRRARILGGKVNIESPENGGTRVTLRLPTWKLALRRT
ncbi:histidine kinase [Haloferula sp.]|uniref:histidine kinase n=1 Tax=Haloferula sp. TaxID=2497595 RepID=UPI00329BB095